MWLEQIVVVNPVQLASSDVMPKMHIFALDIYIQLSVNLSMARQSSQESLLKVKMAMKVSCQKTTEQQYAWVALLMKLVPVLRAGYWDVLVDMLAQEAPVLLPRWCGSGMENRWLVVAGLPSLRAQLLEASGCGVTFRSPTLVCLMLVCTSVSLLMWTVIVRWSPPHLWDWTQVGACNSIKYLLVTFFCLSLCRECPPTGERYTSTCCPEPSRETGNRSSGIRRVSEDSMVQESNPF